MLKNKVTTFSKFIAYFYRLVSIPLATLLLILGSLFYGMILIPFFVLILRKNSIEEIRLLISNGTRAYLYILDKLNLLKVITINLDKIDHKEPVIYIANHPSVFDVLFFISIFPNCCCIAKKSLKKFSPYFLVINWAKYITESKDFKIIDRAKEELMAGRPIVIFPEGTRSTKKNQEEKSVNFKFHRGAANIHISSKSPIIPVSLISTPPALSKDHKWFEVPKEKCTVSMKFNENFKFSDKCKYSDYRGILSRQITKELEHFYKINLFN